MSAIASSPATAHYREAFERLRSTLGGSASRRAVAMERFAELGFPGTREEAWKYTSLRRLESRRFVPAAPTTELVDVPAAFVAQRLVLANGSPVGIVPASLGGFALGTLATAPEDQLLRAFGGGGTERFAALNAALTTGPLLLSTTAGQQSDDVLQLTLVTTGSGPTLASPRIAVRMAPGSRARLLIDHVDDGAQSAPPGGGRVRLRPCGPLAPRAHGLMSQGERTSGITAPSVESKHPSTQANAIERFTEMPSAIATWWSSATAVIVSPVRVRLKNHDSPIAARAVMTPPINRLVGISTSPMITG